MAITKGLLTKKAVDLIPNSYALNPSGSSAPVLRGIATNAPSSMEGDDSSGIRNYVYGLSKELSEGSPSAPCIRLEYPSFWRFRWVVKPGQRQISVRVKQVKAFTGQRPILTVKANSNVGLTTDQVAVAPNGTDWVVVGPIIFTATGTDMVYVEVENRLQMTNGPLFIDRIVAT
jgi:hypothetical protein